MSFAEKSISIRERDRRITQQVVSGKKENNLAVNNLDFSGKRDRRSTQNKKENDEDNNMNDNESETFIYQGTGEDMNSEINGVSDFQSSFGD
jgi:hypothetical protein